MMSLRPFPVSVSEDTRQFAQAPGKPCKNL